MQAHGPRQVTKAGGRRSKQKSLKLSHRLRGTFELESVLQSSRPPRDQSKGRASSGLASHPRDEEQVVSKNRSRESEGGMSPCEPRGVRLHDLCTTRNGQHERPGSSLLRQVASSRAKPCGPQGLLHQGVCSHGSALVSLATKPALARGCPSWYDTASSSSQHLETETLGTGYRYTVRWWQLPPAGWRTVIMGSTMKCIVTRVTSRRGLRGLKPTT